MQNVDVLFKIIKNEHEIDLLKRKIEEYNNDIINCNDIINTSNILYNFINNIINDDKKKMVNEDGILYVKSFFEDKFMYLSPILMGDENDRKSYENALNNCEIKLDECKLINSVISNIDISYEYSKEILKPTEYHLNNKYEKSGFSVIQKVSMPLKTFEKINKMITDFNTNNKGKEKKKCLK